EQERARSRRRVALHLYEVKREKEEHARERSVQQERQQVRAAEVGGAEQSEWEHRIFGARLGDDEQDERATAADEGRDDGRVAEAEPIRFDQAEYSPAQSERRQRRARKIQTPARFCVLAFGGVPVRDQQRGGGERHVDEEGRAPRDVLNEPAADDGAEGGR